MTNLPPDLTNLREHTEKVLALLNAPELGLRSWWHFLRSELHEIAQYAPKVSGEVQK